MILVDKKNNMRKKKGMIVSGYFNPIHKGHIEYFNNAKEVILIYF
jgi:nicotinic acid mononucleotide adenylyltransferase